MSRNPSVATYQWQITHGVHDDPLVLRCVLCYAAQSRLHHMMAVQKLLFRTRLHPHFVLKNGIQCGVLQYSEYSLKPSQQTPCNMPLIRTRYGVSFASTNSYLYSLSATVVLLQCNIMSWLDHIIMALDCSIKHENSWTGTKVTETVPMAQHSSTRSVNLASSTIHWNWDRFRGLIQY